MKSSLFNFLVHLLERRVLFAAFRLFSPAPVSAAALTRNVSLAELRRFHARSRRPGCRDPLSRS